MMQQKQYQVLARKYRPQLFSEVVGQQAVVTTLKNAVRNSRVAHAYLFCGLRGTGKTTLARLFAKILNCKHREPHTEEPCNACASCKEIAAGHAMDVLEIDGASHRGIEDIRQINETIGFMPATGNYKIYLIDEVHMLTKEAFNALLKTLEEPPSHAKFFFATTEPHKIPSTILSRCQRFNLGRITLEQLHEKLKSISRDLALAVDDDALLAVAELAEGSLRDAESLFDQVIAYQAEKITLETVAEVLGLVSRDLFFSLDHSKNYMTAFEIAEQIFFSGKNIGFFLEELLGHFRILFLLKQGVGSKGRDEKRYASSAELYRPEELLQILDLIGEAQNSLKYAVSQRTALEMLLLRILRVRQSISIDHLLQRLLDLEKRLPSGENKNFTATSEIPKTPAPPKQIEKGFTKEDPSPAPHELPKRLSSAPSARAKTEQKSAPKKEAPPKMNINEQSRFDTIMQFAAKELNGFLKKE